jgi:hypothetical protein
LQWLSRDLDDAMLAFVRKAHSGDAIRGCFYEFSYGPVLAELAEAIERGVDVKLWSTARSMNTPSMRNSRMGQRSPCCTGAVLG